MTTDCRWRAILLPPAGCRAARLLVALLGTLFAGCAPAESASPRLVVSAAASLAEVVGSLAERYRKVEPRVTIVTNLAGSGALVQQIRHGAGVDLFISASEREVALLREEGLVDEGSIATLASNELVLVVPDGADAKVGFGDLGKARIRRVALGAPASVPAGAYAMQVLRHLGVWDEVEGKAVYATNVRQALTWVESEEVDAALVYRTDALRSGRVRIAAVAPAGTHSPIRYVGAVVARSGQAAEATDFLEFVAGPEGAAVFRGHGFPVPAPPEAN